jgi:tetratricopeptide (TPR) repeat protein
MSALFEPEIVRKNMKASMKTLVRCALLGLVLLGFGPAAVQAEETAEDYVKLGIQAMDAEKYDQAIAYFTQALRINPKLITVYLLRGSVYNNTKRHDEAIADFNQVLQLNPDITVAATTYLSRGLAYGQKGQFERALADFNQVLRLNPRHGEAYSSRAITHYWLRNYDRAWADVKQAESLGVKSTPEFLRDLRRASGRER